MFEETFLSISTSKRPLCYLKIHHLLTFEQNLCRSAHSRVSDIYWTLILRGLLDLSFLNLSPYRRSSHGCIFYFSLFSRYLAKGIYWNGSLDCQPFERFLLLFLIKAKSWLGFIFYEIILLEL